MKRRRSTPLLRVAAMAAAMASCSKLAQGGLESDVEPAEHATSRIHLRGVIDLPEEATQKVYLEVTTSAGTTRVDIPNEGPWPRAFHLTDADLAESLGTGDSIHLAIYREVNGSAFYKQEIVLPPRASGLVLNPYQPYLPPTPGSATPTEAAVLAMPSAEPSEAGSHLDLEGVIVFDNRHGIPERIGVSVRGAKKGIVHKSFVPTASPFRFRIQDSDASEGYPFSGDTVELWVKVRYGAREDTAIEQTLNIPVKSKGIVAVPVAHEPSKPAAIELTAVTVDLQGVVKAPEVGPAKEVRLRVMHSAGTITKTLPVGDWPLAFHLTGPEFADIPVSEHAKTLLVTVSVTTEDGPEQHATLNVPFKSTDLVLEPKELKPRPDIEIPERPRYGNTKGSRYDDGPPRRGRPLPQDPPG